MIELICFVCIGALLGQVGVRLLTLWEHSTIEKTQVHHYHDTMR